MLIQSRVFVAVLHLSGSIEPLLNTLISSITVSDSSSTADALLYRRTLGALQRSVLARTHREILASQSPPRTTTVRSSATRSSCRFARTGRSPTAPIQIDFSSVAVAVATPPRKALHASPLPLARPVRVSGSAPDGATAWVSWAVGIGVPLLSSASETDESGCSSMNNFQDPFAGLSRERWTLLVFVQAERPTSAVIHISERIAGHGTPRHGGIRPSAHRTSRCLASLSCAVRARRSVSAQTTEGKRFHDQERQEQQSVGNHDPKEMISAP